MADENPSKMAEEPPVSVDDLISFSGISDEEARQYLAESWDFYDSNTSAATRNSLFSMIDKFNSRDSCRPVIENILKKVIEKAYAACWEADVHGDGPIQVLGRVNTFNHIIYKLEMLGYSNILTEHQKNINQVAEMENNAKPNSHQNNGGP